MNAKHERAGYHFLNKASKIPQQFCNLHTEHRKIENEREICDIFGEISVSLICYSNLPNHTCYTKKTQIHLVLRISQYLQVLLKTLWTAGWLPFPGRFCWH